MVAQIVDDLILRWRVCNPVVDARLAKADERMAEGYARRAPQEVYHFEEGDLVWMKQRRRGKMLPKATGPHTFCRYTTNSEKTAEIELVTGKKICLSAM